MKSPVRVTVTGAAGQISYGLLFRIAAGNMLGPRPAGHSAAFGNHSCDERTSGRRHGTRRLCLSVA